MYSPARSMCSARPAAGRACPIAITGIGASTALGRGTGQLMDGVLAGKPAFLPVTRFRTDRCPATAAAERRGAAPLAWLAGWGRAGDAYDVCQPHPEGTGLARAIGNALRRAGAGPADVGYVNANGTGTPYADASEAAALRRALGGCASRVPVSSTKSVHGHALEASALVELIVTVLAVRSGRLPVNAGFLAPDPDCDLDLVLGTAREAVPGYGLSLNAAFGGANTALV